MIGSDLNEKYDTLVAELARVAAALETFEFVQSDQQHSPGYREWERFTLVDGGTCDANGALTVSGSGDALLVGRQGWEGYLTSVAITVSGASSAATVALYAGGASDQNLLDFVSQMLGNSPSRVVGFYDQETAYFSQGQRLGVVVTGAVASATVIIRATGKRRQV